MAAAKAEESPGSTETRCRLTAGGGDPRESATENKPPARFAGRVRVKRWGKSPPRDRQRKRHGKPHREQDRIGTAREQSRDLCLDPAVRVGCLRRRATGVPDEWPSRGAFAAPPYRTRLTGRLISKGARRCWRRAPSTYQPACKPGSVRRGLHKTRVNALLLAARDGHSSGTPVARRLQQPTRTTGPGHRSRSLRHAPSLFGLAPGGVCRAASVAGSAVRSYRTVSPLPSPSRDQAVYFLWHCP